MSVSLPQEIFRKTSTDSQETSELSSSGNIPDGRFRELLQVLPIDDNPREKNVFELVEEEEEEKFIDGPGCVPISLNPISSEKKADNADTLALSCLPSVFSPIPFHATSHFTAAAIQHSLPPEIEAIFEKMASSMIVMSSSEETETTLFLDNPASLFYGTKVTIREFSTAPKAFNVEITSFTPMVNVIESSKNDLLSAFQHGNFNFSIHRLETSIHREERPVLHRKESSDGDSEQRGGREE